MQKKSIKLYVGVSILLSMFLTASCTQETKQNRFVPRLKRDQVPLNAKGTLVDTDPELQRLEKGDEEVAPENWFTKDPELDKTEGVSADRAYKDLNLVLGKNEVIVAVIDSGVDTTHEDLLGNIWVNTNEVPDNGVDDDKNGYVDDVNGWNFLGNLDAQGNKTYIDATTLEVTREFVRMKILKQKRLEVGLDLNTEEQAYLDKLEGQVKFATLEANSEVTAMKEAKEKLKPSFELLKEKLKVSFDELNLVVVEGLTVESNDEVFAKASMVEVFKTSGVSSVARMNRIQAYYQESLDYYYNESFDPRKEIIGDDPFSMKGKAYGNNDVKGPDASHGTHVSGIIAATRGNNIGIEGVATDVKIMAIRAVPNGDEYDKDVANSVYYAVNNGAKVISMSFGKAYSPLKEEVDKAFKYAESKGVLLVHAAGNDAKNNDDMPSFPNRFLRVSSSSQEQQVSESNVIETWMDIGASAFLKGESLPAFFSNYGVKTVDLFAPGHQLKSTIPDLNQYATYSGTSMATPVVSGVAALVLSQHPNMNALELKKVLMESTTKYLELQVLQPNEEGNPLLVMFESLSITGGIVNAYNALKALD